MQEQRTQRGFNMLSEENAALKSNFDEFVKKWEEKPEKDEEWVLKLLDKVTRTLSEFKQSVLEIKFTYHFWLFFYLLFFLIYFYSIPFKNKK